MTCKLWRDDFKTITLHACRYIKCLSHKLLDITVMSCKCSSTDEIKPVIAWVETILNKNSIFLWIANQLAEFEEE